MTKDEFIVELKRLYTIAASKRGLGMVGVAIILQGLIAVMGQLDYWFDESPKEDYNEHP